MTWAEALATPGTGERRRRLFRAARAAGLTYRTIAATAGLSVSTVYDIVGQRQSTQEELLQLRVPAGSRLHVQAGA